MKSFNHSGKYICECGKEFEKSNSFNAHKSHCKIHFEAKYGNLDYYNQFHKERALKIKKTSVEKANIKKEQNLLIWVGERHICEKCGKVMTEKFGSGKFCSEKCSHLREMSDELRNKISESVKTSKKYLDFLANYKNTHKPSEKSKFCKVCGKSISIHTNSGFCKNCLNTTDLGKNYMSMRIKEGQAKALDEGKQFGWQSRNLISYPEQFWIEVLNNNNIKYVHELPVKNMNNKNYFLDFYIEINGIKLDLEIDGSQHKNRKSDDLKRDTFLSSIGYTIYRVEWNEINSDRGKLQMKDKIDEFLKFYNSLQ